MRVIAIANDGVQKRAQDSHSAFNEEKRFEPEVDAVILVSGRDKVTIARVPGKVHEINTNAATGK